MDAINSPKTITFLSEGQNENTYIDQLYTGKVDQGDLDALSGDAYKASVLQFTGERLSLDDYSGFTAQFAKDFPKGSFRDNPAARPKYTNSQKTGLGDKANAAGHDLVEDFLKDMNPDKIVNFVKSAAGKDGTDAQGNKTKTYTIDYNGVKITYIEGVQKDKNGKDKGNGKIQGGNVQ